MLFYQRCQKCVVDLDLHCLVTMNCIGRGNRRVFALFVMTASALCLLYLLLAIWVEHRVHCVDAQGMVRHSSKIFFFIN
jgi:hypothetical protein